MYTRNIFAVLIAACFLVGCGEEKPEALIASAKESLVKNDQRTAVIQIKNVLQKNPDMPEARFLLGVALLASGDPVNAEIEFEKARKLKYPDDLVVPQLAKALLTQGKFKKISDDFSKIELVAPAAIASFQTSLSSAYSAQNMPEPAQKALDAALQAEPENADALMIRVRKLALKSDFPAAMELIDNILQKTPRNTEAGKLKGDLIFYAKNDMTGAIEQYRKSLEITPNFLLGHFAIITLLLQQEKLEDAAKQIEVLKSFAANNPQTKFFETQLAYQKKDLKTARELSQQFLRMLPDNARGLQLAGAIEYQLGSFLQAEIYLNKTIATAPSFQSARRLLTLIYLRTGQPAKALTTLLPALEQNSVDSSLFTMAGEVYFKNGDLNKAGEYFSKAAKLDPKDTRKSTALALTHMIGGNVESAFNELRDIASSDSGTTADMALIGAYIRRREFDNALKAIDDLEKKQPKNPLAWDFRGKIQIAQKNFLAARKSFEAALVLNPTYYPAVSSLALLDIAEKKPDDAKKRFESVLVKEPENMQALLGLAEMRARMGAKKEEVVELLQKAIVTNPSAVAPHMLLVDLYFSSKDYKLAFTAAQNAATKFPDNPEVLDALGRSQQATGDANQAISTYNKLVSMRPSSPLPFLRLANINIGEKNKDAAVQNFNKALELKPDLIEAQRGIVLLDVESGKYQDAINMARLIQRQRPKEVVGYALEGDINIAQKRWGDAAEMYKTVLKKNSSFEFAMKLHAILLAAEKKSEADAFSAAWLRENPKDVGFILYLANAALVKKDFPNAEKLYLTVVNILPNNSVAYNNLAWITGQLKKESALSYAEKANSISPNQPAFMDTMAMLLAEKGDYVKAIELQRKVVVLQPNSNVFKMNLAKIYIKSGDKASAKPILVDLAKLGDKFSGRVEVDNMLKSF